MLNDQIRMEKNGEEVKFFSHTSQELKKYNILKNLIIHALPIDLVVVGYVYQNQFIVTDFLGSGEDSFKDDQNLEMLNIIIDGFDMKDPSNSVCLLDSKKVCSECGNFPCSCEDKTREERDLDVPIYILREEDKITLALESANINSNIAIELARDGDEEVRKALYENVDKEILLQKAVSNLQKGEEELGVVLSSIQNPKIPGFLISKLWDISKEDLVDNYRHRVIDIIQHENLVDNLSDRMYEYLKEKNIALTPDEEKALVLSSETSLENKKEIRDNYSGDTISQAVMDKAISEHEEVAEEEARAQRRIDQVREQEEMVDEDGWTQGSMAGGMVQTHKGPGVQSIPGD
jgi:hypothetical protein